MPDLTTEALIPLAVACRLVPPARSGKRTHLSTLLRWILRGSKSPTGEVVRLEALRLGGRWMTSREALQRYAEELTPRSDRTETPPPPAPRCPGKRRRESERAAAELKQLGY